MAVNQQRGLVRINTTLNGRASPTESGIDLPASGGEQAARSVAAAHGSVANELADLGNVIGKYADHAAAVEGERAGRQAGLDPEFRPTRAITIRGEAYDRAGLDVYRSTVAIEIDNDIASGGDLGKKREGWLARVPEELRPDVVHKFRRAEISQARQAARAHAARIKTESQVALQSELDTSIKTLHQRAFQLGLDGKSDELIARDLSDLEQLLARTGADGKPIVSPSSARKNLIQAKEVVADARLLGAFDRLPSVAAKKAMLDKIEDDFKNSRGVAKIYDLPGYRRITGQLGAELRRAQTEDRARSSAVLNDIKDLQRFAEKGHAPTPDQLAGIRARAEATSNTDVTAQLALVEDIANWQQGARRATPAEIDAYAAQVRDGIKEHGPNEVSVGRLEMAEKLATEARKEIKKDPIGWADRVGLVNVTPLDFSEPDKAAVSVKARVAQAEAVASHYKIAPTYLQPEERRVLATIASQGGAQTLEIATTLSQAAGDRAPAVLSEVFDEAPTIAVLAGHVHEAGVTSAARDAADGLALAKTEGFKPLAPKKQQAREIAVQVGRGAFTAMPRAEQAVMSLANKIYEVRARRAGVEEFDVDLWEAGFREAIGERTHAGDTYGGIALRGGGWLFGGRAIVVPPNIKQDGFDDVINAIRLDDLVDVFGAPLDKADKPVSIEAVRRAEFVTVGHGKYWLAMGDIDSGDPQFLKGGNGRPYELDLNALAPRLSKRRPDLYFGGR